MKGRFALSMMGAIALLLVAGTASASPAYSPIGTSFTYQGRLTDGGLPANGSYDFQFKLFDADTGGSQVGSTLAKDDISVTDGVFTVELDFGSVFSGTALYLEVGVRAGSGEGSDPYTTLAPRQKLSATPYAIHASSAPWSGLSGVPAGLDDGDNDTTYLAGTGLTLSAGAFSVDTSAIQQRVSSVCAPGSAISSIAADGSVACQSVGSGDITGVTAGPGLSGGATSGNATLSADWAAIQARVGDSCAAGSAISGINSDGSIVCHVDLGGDITAVVAGNGLIGGATSGDAPLQVSFGGSGGAITVARSDHNHDATYVNEGQGDSINSAMIAAGAVTFNDMSLNGCGGGQVVKSDGFGWYCGSDSDTLYSAGIGLSQLGNQFSVVYGGSGGALTSARSDHNHDAGYVNEGQGDSISSAMIAAGAVTFNDMSLNGCGGGQVVKSNGSTWTCGSDADTLYTAGTGLTMLSNQFSVNYAGSGSAGSASRSDHNHWGQSWTGSGAGLTLSGGTVGVNGAGSTYGITGSSPAGYGVHGVSSSSYGVYGMGTGGVYGNGGNYGVRGESAGGLGVIGQSTNGFGVGGYSSTNAGVYGQSTSAYGVYGVGDSASAQGVRGDSQLGTGVWGYSNSLYGVRGESNSGYGLYATGVTGVYGAGSSYAGYFSGDVYVVGDFTVAPGWTKSGSVNTQDYGTRKLYAMESPENWFEDFGFGELVDGAAVITIEPVFAQTVNLNEGYHVFLTPVGECALYVADKTPTSFTVRSIGGACSVEFDYRIVAKRLGFEGVRLEEVENPPATMLTAEEP